MTIKYSKKCKITCKECGCVFEVIPSRANRKFCSAKCYFLKPENNPFYGKHHSIETKKKLSISNIGKKRSDEIKALFSSQNTGCNNPFFGKKHSDETKKVISQKNIERNLSGKNNPFFGKKHSKEVRLKMSQTRSRKIASGEINPINTSRKGVFRGIRYDSLYELKRIYDLINDTKIKRFKKNDNIIINYEFNGKHRKYIPDFFIEYNNGIKVIEEIKGYEKPVDLVKYKAATEQLKEIGIEYRVIYKCNLFNSETEYRKFLKDNPK